MEVGLYFNLDNYSDQEILLKIKEYTKNAIYNHEKFKSDKLVDIDNLWDVLEIRQYCKLKDKMISVLESLQNEFLYYKDTNNVKVLWDFDCSIWDPIDFKFDDESDQEDVKSEAECQEWGTIYSVNKTSGPW